MKNTGEVMKQQQKEQTTLNLSEMRYFSFAFRATNTVQPYLGRNEHVKNT